MRALTLQIDGEQVATASLAGHTVALTIICCDEPNTNRLRLGGIDGENHFDWYEVESLPVGTSIQVDFIETDKSDSPSIRPVDQALTAKSDRERFESAKKTYFALRNRYECDTDE